MTYDDLTSCGDSKSVSFSGEQKVYYGRNTVEVHFPINRQFRAEDQKNEKFHFQLYLYHILTTNKS